MIKIKMFYNFVFLTCFHIELFQGKGLLFNKRIMPGDKHDLPG